MKPKALIPLIVGLGVGFLAIKMGVDMIQRAKGDSGGDTRTVLVAERQIEVASRVTEQMFTSRKVPAALVPDDAFTDAKTLAGRVTKVTIPAGVAIGGRMLAPPGTEPGLRAKIPSGYRAVSVQVNEASAVAGFVMPGSRVDVFATTGGRRQATDSRLILSDIEVGAVGQSMNEVGPDGKTVRITKSVTLLLRPEQVPLLHAATAQGQIRLALRGDQERPGGGEPSLLARMLESWANRPANAVAMAAPENGQHVVTVMHGTRMERLVFANNRVIERSGDGPVEPRAAGGDEPIPAAADPAADSGPEDSPASETSE